MEVARAAVEERGALPVLVEEAGAAGVVEEAAAEAVVEAAAEAVAVEKGSMVSRRFGDLLG